MNDFPIQIQPSKQKINIAGKADEVKSQNGDKCCKTCLNICNGRSNWKKFSINDYYFH